MISNGRAFLNFLLPSRKEARQASQGAFEFIMKVYDTYEMIKVVLNKWERWDIDR